MLIFDTTTYSSGTFNSADFMNKLSAAGVKLMGEFSDCKMTELFYAIDNRLSDYSFMAGTAANLVALGGMAIFGKGTLYSTYN